MGYHPLTHIYPRKRYPRTRSLVRGEFVLKVFKAASQKISRWTWDAVCRQINTSFGTPNHDSGSQMNKLHEHMKSKSYQLHIFPEYLQRSTHMMANGSLQADHQWQMAKCTGCPNHCLHRTQQTIHSAGMAPLLSWGYQKTKL